MAMYLGNEKVAPTLSLSDTHSEYQLAKEVITEQPETLISIEMGENALWDYKKEMLIEMYTPKNAEATANCNLQIYFAKEPSVNRVIDVYTCQSGSNGPLFKDYNITAIYETKIFNKLMYTLRYITNYGAQGYPQPAWGAITNIDPYVGSTQWKWLNITVANTAQYPSLPAGTIVRVYTR